MPVQPIKLTQEKAGMLGATVFAWLATWALGAGDSGEATDSTLIPWLDRTFQVEGTFGGATLLIEGTNDGTNWETLNDPQGVPLSITTACIKQVTEVVTQMRPRIVGGSGTALNVTAFMRSTTPNG